MGDFLCIRHRDFHRKKDPGVLGDGLISKQDYRRIFEESGIGPLSRPEDLDVNLWLKLFRKSLSLKKEPV